VWDIVCPEQGASGVPGSIPEFHPVSSTAREHRAVYDDLFHMLTYAPTPCASQTGGPPEALLTASLIDRAIWIAEEAQVLAPELDSDDAFPVQSLARLSRLGLLVAPLPPDEGGSYRSHGRANGIDRLGLATDAAKALGLAQILRIIGAGSLPLGRLYEGHVNAILLIATYGTRRQLAEISQEVERGALLGVWNTETAAGLKLLGGEGGGTLAGGKIFASGAGYLTRPLVTAKSRGNALLMMLPHLKVGERVDMRRWQVQGMRASASGDIDLTGVEISPFEIIGSDDDYHREPLFSAGAWRFAAVQSGGIWRIVDIVRQHLRKTRRGGDALQEARFGRMTLQLETTRMWVESAARIAADETRPAVERIAYVNLCRTAVEAAGMETIELAQKSVGLSGFLRRHPLDLACRDLATYLRQSAPDRALANAAAHYVARGTAADFFWRPL